MTMAIPDTMSAVVLREYREKVTDAIDGLCIEHMPVPRPKRGQVLVRIEAAPCNPSDLLLLQGKYGSLKKLPTVPGWEGAGTVVTTGGGWLARWLNGKRVACGLQGDRPGTWAEYFVANAKECIPLKPQLDIEQAAGLIINPLTAMGLLETARREGHRAAVHTAAASQLGRMLQAIADDAGYPLIHVVRRQAQLEVLKSRGARYVLDSSDELFGEQLRSLCHELKATTAFEAVGGDMTGTVLNAMPAGSIVYLYGALSEEPCGSLDPVEIIFRNKTVTGFYLGDWLRRRGALSIFRTAGRVERLLVDGRIRSEIQRRAPLVEVPDSLKQYINNMTAGKILIMPHHGGND
jgi:NADPH:quinone reductase